MGLHIGDDAAHQHTVVQHPKFARHCSVPVWNGRHDNAEDAAQGHLPLQSD